MPTTWKPLTQSDCLREIKMARWYLSPIHDKMSIRELAYNVNAAIEFLTDVADFANKLTTDETYNQQSAG